jgi:hypothetical protein
MALSVKQRRQAAGVRLNGVPVCYDCGCYCPLQGLSVNGERVCLDCLDGEICVAGSCCQWPSADEEDE